ncbi:MAG: hypothetical protein ACE5K2_07985 [Candidatus Zixiibacteriota bacterium]
MHVEIVRLPKAKWSGTNHTVSVDANRDQHGFEYTFGGTDKGSTSSPK